MANYFEGKWIENRFAELERLITNYGDTLMVKADEILAAQATLKTKIMALKELLTNSADGISAAQAQAILDGVNEMLALADPPAPPVSNGDNP